MSGIKERRIKTIKIFVKGKKEKKGRKEGRGSNEDMCHHIPWLCPGFRGCHEHRRDMRDVRIIAHLFSGIQVKRRKGRM